MGTNWQRVQKQKQIDLRKLKQRQYEQLQKQMQTVQSQLIQENQKRIKLQNEYNQKRKEKEDELKLMYLAYEKQKQNLKLENEKQTYQSISEISKTLTQKMEAQKEKLQNMIYQREKEAKQEQLRISKIFQEKQKERERLYREMLQKEEQRSKIERQSKQKFQKLFMQEKKRAEQIQAFLHKQSQALHQAQSKVKKTATKENMSRLIDQTYHQYIDNIKPLKAEMQSKNQGWINVTMIGEVSAGKSSLFNWILKTKQDVGLGQITDFIQQVFKNEQKRIKYFDCPGFTQAIDISNVHMCQNILGINLAFIVTAHTFKNSHRAIQIMLQLIPGKVFFVRTQCDKFDEQGQDISKQINKDRQYLQKAFNLKDVDILCISCRRPDDYRDNLKFKNLLQNLQ